MRYKVDSNIPIPRPYLGRKYGVTVKYPWDKMDKGDSFFVKCSSETLQKTRSTVLNAGKAYCRKYRPELRPLIRRVKGGIRVWFIGAEER